MGGRSSSSSSTSNTTVTQDNRVAAADSGVAVGQDGFLDQSVGAITNQESFADNRNYADNSVTTITNTTTAEGLTDAAAAIFGDAIRGFDSLNESVTRTNDRFIDGQNAGTRQLVEGITDGTRLLIDGLTEGTRQTQNTLKEVFGESIDFADTTTGRGFDFLGSISGEQYELVDDVLAGAFAGVERSQDEAYDFSARVLDGYEQNALEADERQLRQWISAGTVVLVIAIIAWAVRKG